MSYMVSSQITNKIYSIALHAKRPTSTNYLQYKIYLVTSCFFIFFLRHCWRAPGLIATPWRCYVISATQGDLISKLQIFFVLLIVYMLPWLQQWVSRNSVDCSSYTQMCHKKKKKLDTASRHLRPMLLAGQHQKNDTNLPPLILAIQGGDIGL